ncbi:MAG: GTP-binding protein [Lachnospiraceae bacterium]|nr:GTP-binding protein [Lachnospiraceae bacterium]
MTKIDIVSGFLGAGKTTLIKKLLSEALKGEQVVLIENEFGEIGVDGGFLKEAGIEITEMNSGCICCSLVGDFATALKEVLQKYHPERILIEPSGVGKLSDVMAAIQNAGLEDAALNSAVAVVDASKAKMYIKNFGEFFINQIEHAGTIILSRTGNISEEKLNKAIELIREHNAKATIVTTPWELVEGKAILETIEGAKDLEKELLEEVMKHHAEHEHEHHHHDHDHEHEHHHDHDEHEHHHHDHDEHEHHHHDHEEHDHEHEHGNHCSCGCGHDHGHEGHHHADEVFDSIGFETTKAYSKADIERFLEDLEDDDKYGMVLRSKGIVASTDSDEWIHFDYTPGEVNVRYGKADVTGKIVVIGAQIEEEAIKELFA